MVALQAISHRFDSGLAYKMDYIFILSGVLRTNHPYPERRRVKGTAFPAQVRRVGCVQLPLDRGPVGGSVYFKYTNNEIAREYCIPFFIRSQGASFTSLGGLAFNPAKPASGIGTSRPLRPSLEDRGLKASPDGGPSLEGIAFVAGSKPSCWAECGAPRLGLPFCQIWAPRIALAAWL